VLSATRKERVKALIIVLLSVLVLFEFSVIRFYQWKLEMAERLGRLGQKIETVQQQALEHCGPGK